MSTFFQRGPIKISSQSINMASCLKFVVDSKEMQDKFETLNHQVELSEIIYFIEARNIQAWFRGVSTRSHIRRLNTIATVIQRHWRGYQARCVARKFLTDRVNAKWTNRYDLLATRIQAAWRGYRARKNGIDVNRMKKWKASIYEKNKQSQKRMRSFRDAQFESLRDNIESQSLPRLLFILFKVHHLMSTKQCPGIVSSMDRARLTSIEKMIECLEYGDYVKKKRMKNIHCKQQNDIDESLRMNCVSRFKECAGGITDFENSLHRGNIDKGKGEETQMSKL